MGQAALGGGGGCVGPGPSPVGSRRVVVVGDPPWGGESLKCPLRGDSAHLGLPTSSSPSPGSALPPFPGPGPTPQPQAGQEDTAPQRPWGGTPTFPPRPQHCLHGHTMALNASENIPPLPWCPLPSPPGGAEMPPPTPLCLPSERQGPARFRQMTGLHLLPWATLLPGGRSP